MQTFTDYKNVDLLHFGPESIFNTYFMWLGNKMQSTEVSKDFQLFFLIDMTFPHSYPFHFVSYSTGA